MTNRWPMLRVMLTAHVSFTLIIWALLMVVSALVTLGIAIWGDVDRSIWHYAATQALRWLALGLGFDAITTYLRLHVAHGRTRADFLRQLWPYLLGLATTLGLLVGTGYLLERGVYALAGWSPEVPSLFNGTVPPLFGTTANIPGIVGSFALTFALWALVGTLISAAMNRHLLLGLAAVAFGFVLIAPSETMAGSTGVPLIQNVLEAMHLPTGASIGFGLAGTVVGGVAIWGVVRDMPLRPRVA